MYDDVLEFIMRRFPLENDCNWMSGNCYYFAKILDERFHGELYYDMIEGHFLFYKNKRFYDWTGIRYPCEFRALTPWNGYEKVDKAHYDRIVRDVIM